MQLLSIAAIALLSNPHIKNLIQTGYASLNQIWSLKLAIALIHFNTI